jgi:hypothetical protein
METTGMQRCDENDRDAAYVVGVELSPEVLPGTTTSDAQRRPQLVLLVQQPL